MTDIKRPRIALLIVGAKDTIFVFNNATFSLYIVNIIV